MGVQIPPPLPDFGGAQFGWIDKGKIMAEEAVVRKSSRDDEGTLEQAKGLWQRLRQYNYEVRTETKRVTWPSRQEIYGTTVMVILTTFLFGTYFWLCDTIFQQGMSRLLNYLMHRG
jgi:preprotein translocase subunit SecE